MYPSPFLRTLESEFRRSKSTNGCSFAIQAVIDDFFWILANSFAAKELAVGFHKKNAGFHRTRFLKNIIESERPAMPRAEFFCVLLRSLPSVTPEPASRWSACPPCCVREVRLCLDTDPGPNSDPWVDGVGRVGR